MCIRDRVNALKDLSAMNGDILRKYPDPDATDIVESLAEYHGVNKENVFVGVGSDDVLATAFLTFFNFDKPIILPVSYTHLDVYKRQVALCLKWDMTKATVYPTF